MATKQQEREALKKIQEIVAGLGEDSYIMTAFAGCFELAERNIDDDAAFSMQERWERAEAEAKEAREKLTEAEAKVKALTRRIELYEGWRPYEDAHNAKQSWYEKLAEDARELSDEEAIKMIADEFGFVPERITIIHEVPKQEISNQQRVRTVGQYERKPLFEAWDYNYIRFNVKANGTMAYEMVDGQLNLFWN